MNTKRLGILFCVLFMFHSISHGYNFPELYLNYGAENYENIEDSKFCKVLEGSQCVRVASNGTKNLIYFKPVFHYAFESWNDGSLRRVGDYIYEPKRKSGITTVAEGKEGVPSRVVSGKIWLTSTFDGDKRLGKTFFGLLNYKTGETREFALKENDTETHFFSSWAVDDSIQKALLIYEPRPYQRQPQPYIFSIRDLTSGKLIKSKYFYFDNIASATYLAGDASGFISDDIVYFVLGSSKGFYSFYFLDISLGKMVKEVRVSSKSLPEGSIFGSAVKLINKKFVDNLYVNYEGGDKIYDEPNARSRYTKEFLNLDIPPVVGMDVYTNTKSADSDDDEFVYLNTRVKGSNYYGIIPFSPSSSEEIISQSENSITVATSGQYATEFVILKPEIIKPLDTAIVEKRVVYAKGFCVTLSPDDRQGDLFAYQPPLKICIQSKRSELAQYGYDLIPELRRYTYEVAPGRWFDRYYLNAKPNFDSKPKAWNSLVLDGQEVSKDFKPDLSKTSRWIEDPKSGVRTAIETVSISDYFVWQDRKHYFRTVVTEYLNSTRKEDTYSELVVDNNGKIETYRYCKSCASGSTGLTN